MAEIKKHKRTPRIRNLISFSALIMMLFCAMVIYQAVHAYHEALDDGKQQAAQEAHILADHVELTFLGVDLSLRRAIERQYFNTLFGNNLPEYTEQNFKVWLNETPQLVAMAMINEEGEVQVAAHKKSYEHWLDYNKSLAGQELFARLRDADDNDIFIGKREGEDNSPLIIVARRFSKLSGEFGGIMIAAINPDYFIDFYHSIATGDQRFMTLMLKNGAVLASGPYDSPEDEQLAGQLLKRADSADDGVRNQSARVHHDLKLISQVELKHMQVVASVVLDEDDFMGAWRQSRLKDVGFLVLFIIFGSILSFFAIAMAKQIERAEESENAAVLASQAKSEFLANMSHELRTPLNAIIGFSEMLNSGYFGPLNAKQKERIHDITLCGSHLLQLITDILEFSKGDAGKLELAEEKVDMGEIVGECARMMGARIKMKAIHLIVAVEPDLPCLWGDQRKVRQLLINLLSNAVKFTPENGEITVAAKLDAQNNMVLSVADTGIGIAEVDIPKALSVFGQVHRNKSHEGTGLGLPLCKMYAELHDGKLVLTSKLGEGTMVKILFPHQRVLPKKATV